MLGKLILNVSIEFGPIIGFFIASELTSFVDATIILVALMFISLVVGLFERGKITLFPIIAGLTIIGFGIFTIIFKDPFYLIIKDTLYNGIFAIVLFTGLAFGASYLKPIFKDLFAMTDQGWRILSLRWAIMFTLLALSNEIARLFLSPDQWVIYKGVATAATIVFALYQFTLAKKERLPHATPWGMVVRARK